MMRLLASSFACLAVLLAAGVALACPVCGAQNEDGNAAYLVMTGVMSALPLMFMGGVVVWLVKRVRASDQRTSEPEPSEGVSR